MIAAYTPASYNRQVRGKNNEREATYYSNQMRQIYSSPGCCCCSVARTDYQIRLATVHCPDQKDARSCSCLRMKSARIFSVHRSKGLPSTAPYHQIYTFPAKRIGRPDRHRLHAHHARTCLQSDSIMFASSRVSVSDVASVYSRETRADVVW